MKHLKLCAGAAAILVAGTSLALAQAAGAPAAPPPTVIETGTLAGSILQWMMVGATPIIGGGIMLIIKKVLARLGIAVSAAASDQLDNLVVRALHYATDLAADRLKGKGAIEVKNATEAAAIGYVRDHGADLIKALGDDPKSAATGDAIKARISKVIADPSMSTPVSLGGPQPDETISATVKTKSS